MSNAVPIDQIERIVGVTRHQRWHVARAISDEEQVYLLHAAWCLHAFPDLRECPYSRALDNGIDLASWAGWSDRPVVVGVLNDHLTPLPLWPGA